MTRHDLENGDIGIILNRPRGSTLGELATPPERLKQVPVFEGGPVEHQHLLLARIQLMEHGACFESFGQEETSSEEVAFPDHGDLRVFTGYAGWSAGQLEEEILEKSWLILPPTATLLSAVTTPEEGVSRWRGIMKELGSFYRLLAEAPDDLSGN